jgi:hypothetical protein
MTHRTPRVQRPPCGQRRVLVVIVFIQFFLKVLPTVALALESSLGLGTATAGRLGDKQSHQVYLGYRDAGPSFCFNFTLAAGPPWTFVRVWPLSDSIRRLSSTLTFGTSTLISTSSQERLSYPLKLACLGTPVTRILFSVRPVPSTNNSKGSHEPIAFNLFCRRETVATDCVPNLPNQKLHSLNSLETPDRSIYLFAYPLELACLGTPVPRILFSVSPVPSTNNSVGSHEPSASNFVFRREPLTPFCVLYLPKQKLHFSNSLAEPERPMYFACLAQVHYSLTIVHRSAHSRRLNKSKPPMQNNHLDYLEQAKPSR